MARELSKNSWARMPFNRLLVRPIMRSIVKIPERPKLVTPRRIQSFSSFCMVNLNSNSFVIPASEPESITRLSLLVGWIAGQARNDGI